MLIILISLANTNKIQNSFCLKKRLVKIVAQRQNNNFLATIHECSLYDALLFSMLITYN